MKKELVKEDVEELVRICEKVERKEFTLIEGLGEAFIAGYEAGYEVRDGEALMEKVHAILDAKFGKQKKGSICEIQEPECVSDPAEILKD